MMEMALTLLGACGFFICCFVAAYANAPDEDIEEVKPTYKPSNNPLCPPLPQTSVTNPVQTQKPTPNRWVCEYCGTKQRFEPKRDTLCRCKYCNAPKDKTLH